MGWRLVFHDWRHCRKQYLALINPAKRSSLFLALGQSVGTIEKAGAGSEREFVPRPFFRSCPLSESLEQATKGVKSLQIAKELGFPNLRRFTAFRSFGNAFYACHEGTLFIWCFLDTLNWWDANKKRIKGREHDRTQKWWLALCFC